MALDYKSAGVDIEAGDAASKMAYAHAKSTFPSREGMIGAPLISDGGFSGLINMGDFCLTQCCDTVGTKIVVAEKTGNFEGLGQDLLAMVADDAICAGAEVVSITNTFETNKVDAKAIDQMMAGLAKICQEQKIIIAGGEVAEVGNMTNGTSWGADAVGIVDPKKVINGNNIEPGMAIVGLKGRVLRCNGLSLARKICEMNFGEDWENTEWQNGVTWGDVLLTPSKVYQRLIVDAVLGGFGQEPKHDIQGIIHITGGGIPGNVPRIFPEGKTFGAKFDSLHAPHQALKDLQELGKIEEAECYRTWHCGTAMMLVCAEAHAQALCQALNAQDSEVEAQVVGTITSTPKIEIQSGFSNQKINFPVG